MRGEAARVICVSRGPWSDKPIAHAGWRTTQEFFGSPDLDIAPAQPGPMRSIANIYVQGQTTVVFSTNDNIEVTLLQGTTPVANNKPAGHGLVRHWRQFAFERVRFF